MTTRHYIDSRDAEPCGCLSVLDIELDCDPQPDCPTCAGTGRRAGLREPEIEVFADGYDDGDAGFGWEFQRDGQTFGGFAKTKAKALLAARCAAVGIELREYDGLWKWIVSLDQYDTGAWASAPTEHEHLWTTPEAALCAAIDARKEKP